jgi:hypothetical protein
MTNRVHQRRQPENHWKAAILRTCLTLCLPKAGVEQVDGFLDVVLERSTQTLCILLGLEQGECEIAVLRHSLKFCDLIFETQILYADALLNFDCTDGQLVLSARGLFHFLARPHELLGDLGEDFGKADNRNGAEGCSESGPDHLRVRKERGHDAWETNSNFFAKAGGRVTRLGEGVRHLFAGGFRSCSS